MSSHLGWFRKAIAALAVVGAVGGTQVVTAPWAAAATSGKHHHHHHGKHHQAQTKGKHHKKHHGGKGKHTTTTR